MSDKQTEIRRERIRKFVAIRNMSKEIKNGKIRPNVLLDLGIRKVNPHNFSLLVTIPKAFTDNYLSDKNDVRMTMCAGKLTLEPVTDTDTETVITAFGYGSKKDEETLYVGTRKVTNMNFSKVCTLPKIFTDNYLGNNEYVRMTMRDGKLTMKPVTDTETEEKK